jgi:hypothetical protein
MISAKKALFIPAPARGSLRRAGGVREESGTADLSFGCVTPSERLTIFSIRDIAMA